MQNFEFKVGISWGLFLAAGALMIAIALLTVSLQSFRAALTDPVKSLRSE
ncbi:hypothetical protein [Dyadobacter sp. 676]|uniref:ABC transporter permease n=1 Tax=Dyadobacter sp. 676 TaxID=3088362 RepID=A0AAU8FJB6_9BACT